MNQEFKAGTYKQQLGYKSFSPSLVNKPFEWKDIRSEARHVIHPQDGKLEAFLRPVTRVGWFGKKVYEEPSIFPFQEMIVSAKAPFVVEADGKQSKETKIKIKLARKRIEMIVGKERRF